MRSYKSVMENSKTSSNLASNSYMTLPISIFIQESLLSSLAVYSKVEFFDGPSLSMMGRKCNSTLAMGSTPVYGILLRLK